MFPDHRFHGGGLCTCLQAAGAVSCGHAGLRGSNKESAMTIFNFCIYLFLSNNHLQPQAVPVSAPGL